MPFKVSYSILLFFLITQNKEFLRKYLITWGYIYIKLLILKQVMIQ